jgi:hypothetical protein
MDMPEASTAAPESSGEKSQSIDVTSCLLSGACAEGGNSAGLLLCQIQGIRMQQQPIAARAVCITPGGIPWCRQAETQTHYIDNLGLHDKP